MKKRIRYHLILEAQPDTVDPNIRLRTLLKQALRQHRMKCIEVRELKPEEATT